MDATAPLPARLVTGSRRRDLLLLFSILSLMLLLSPRLRVYYQVTVVDVSVERISPDGRAVALATPRSLSHPGNGYWRGDSLMSRLEPRIRRYMERSDWSHDATAGTRFVWTVRWSDDSTRLDQMERIVWEVPDRTTSP